MSLPSGESPWNSIFGPGRRSKYYVWSTKNFGQCSRPSLSPLISTHNKHHLFENKVWVIDIIKKKCIRSLLKSFITGWLFPHIFVYVNVQLYYGYTTICLNQKGDISTLNGSSLKLVEKFTDQGSSVLSTETDINTRLAKAWAANDSLKVIWKSDLTVKIKRSFFFQARVVSILPYGCTTWTLTKRMEKKLRSNYRSPGGSTPTKQQLSGHLPLITKTIQVRPTTHAQHCWRSGHELINDILLWTSSHGRAKAGRPAWTYIKHLCADTGYSLEDLPGAMDDRGSWRERVREIRARSAWWWWYMYIMSCW